MQSYPSVFIACGLFLSGCASYQAPPLTSDNPASPQAEESPRTRSSHLLASDKLTDKTRSQLARHDAPQPNFQGGGMQHDMRNMKGMEGMKDMPGMEGMRHEPPKPASAASPAPAKAGAYWTCVMHPEIHADKPGDCPKCGMTLVKKEEAAK